MQFNVELKDIVSTLLRFLCESRAKVYCLVMTLEVTIRIYCFANRQCIKVLCIYCSPVRWGCHFVPKRILSPSSHRVTKKGGGPQTHTRRSFCCTESASPVICFTDLTSYGFLGLILFLFFFFYFYSGPMVAFIFFVY